MALSQAFTTATFSYCLLWSLSAFGLVFGMWNQIELRCFTWPVKHMLLFASASCLGLLFCWMLIHCPVASDAFGWIWAHKMLVCTHAVIFTFWGKITNKCQCPCSIRIYTCHIVLYNPLSSWSWRLLLIADSEIFTPTFLIVMQMILWIYENMPICPLALEILQSRQWHS